ncbi:MAG: hypothetical protein VB119_09855 [Candidatus Metalachnospira sp.]|nr:hypothetical protein [Candidatus Metalachnospira sp.]
MRLIDIIGILAIIVTLYHLFKKILWNYKNGFGLRDYDNLFAFIILVIITTALTLVPIMLQIILTISMFVSLFVLYKYIDVQNKTKNSNNLGLQSFYISEIREVKRDGYLGASICLVTMIIRLLCFEL